MRSSPAPGTCTRRSRGAAPAIARGHGDEHIDVAELADDGGLVGDDDLTGHAELCPKGGLQTGSERAGQGDGQHRVLLVSIVGTPRREINYVPGKRPHADGSDDEFDSKERSVVAAEVLENRFQKGGIMMSVATTQHNGSSSFATDGARWTAVTRRDSRADGVFFFSVRTAGVYCRPSCAARQARRENVRFHATSADAERAGFRPCKRCRPDGHGLATLRTEAVARACRLIETSEDL